jgi:hypothetical protein
VPILHTRAPVSVAPLSPGKSRDVGAFYLRKSADSFAIFTAMRRASSPRLAPLGHRLGLASLMDGTAPPLPFQLPPFLLRERNSWADVRPAPLAAKFPLMAFCRFPREDATADYECDHRGNKNPKLQVLHRGVLRRLTPLLTHYTSARASSLAPHQLRQLRNVGRDPPHLILAEQLCCRAAEEP